MFVWSKKRTYLLAGLISIGLLLGSQFFALQKPITILADGNTIETHAYFAQTVTDVLEKNDIKLGEKDKVEPALDSVLEKNTKIIVTRAFKVKIIADGQTREVISTPMMVKEVIKLAGFELGSEDIVKTVLTEKTKPNQEIEVIRVSSEQIQVEEPIAYGVERTIDNNLEKGLTRTTQTGKDGLALNTVKIIYHNGQEVKREITDSQVIAEPVNRVIAMGNITNVSRSGSSFDFREARYMVASAYTYTGNRTATGQQPAVGMAAVDPGVIPLGTRLYIEGYGYAQAADTGSSIKGDRLDLFMEDRTQCLSWGRRSVKVYILD
ncbi:MAG TPA: 3D domain-containing protein [Syntrophomonadaceae bacterium]|nr:3D domain-containing protein [Syntrophomonadaceae bacterium]HNX28882.1 3D domain-containing protein [Syntrophomonadaceae bacterium]HPR93251.1 3D domain-containing protein [Syntrophomonadaceae bacterium]